MNTHPLQVCPHCGAHIEKASSTEGNRCPACHQAISASAAARASEARELPELRMPMGNFRTVRLASIAVLTISILLGLLIFFQIGLTQQNDTVRQFELVLLAIFGVGAAFVLTYVHFAMNLKSRH